MRTLYAATLALVLVLGFLVPAVHSQSNTTDPYTTSGGLSRAPDGQQQTGPYDAWDSSPYANSPPGRSMDNQYGYGDENPTGLPPLGGNSSCMGGAGGTDSGAASSGMGSC